MKCVLVGVHLDISDPKLNRALFWIRNIQIRIPIFLKGSLRQNILSGLLVATEHLNVINFILLIQHCYLVNDFQNECLSPVF